MKTSLLILALLCTSIGLKSQATIYASTGVNISNIERGLHLVESTSVVFLQPDNLLSPFLSFGLALPVSSKLFAFSELSYSPKGYTMELIAPSGPLNEKTKIKYDFLDVNLGMAFQLNPIRIEIGGFAGKKLTDKIKIADQDWVSSSIVSSKLNLGVFGGLNVILLDKLSIFGRYYLGLTDISDIFLTDFDGMTIGSLNEKTKNIQIGVSIALQ